MKLATHFSILLCTGLSFAQFTPNISLNTLVSSTANVELASKSFTTPSGKTIVGYVEGYNDAYKIQCINPDGTLGYTANGILLYSNPTGSGIYKDFTEINCDSNNDIVVLNTSLQNGQVRLFLIEQNTGAVLNTMVCGSSAVVHNKLLKTATDSFIVALDGVIAKYTVVGQQFVLDWSNATTSNDVQDIKMVNNTSFYVIGADPGPFAGYQKPKARLFSMATGQAVWPGWIYLTSDYISAIHNVVQSIVNGSDLYVFYRDFSDFSEQRAFTQKIDINGNLLYTSPVVLADDSAVGSASLFFPFIESGTNNILVVVGDTNSQQIRLQKIEANGQLLFQAAGINPFINETAASLMDVQTCADGKPVVLYSDGTHFIKTCKLDYTGAQVWSSGSLTLNNTTNTKDVYNAGMAIQPSGDIITTFIEDRNGIKSVYAQNSDCNGQIPLNRDAFTYNAFSVYPNPAQNSFTVRCNENNAISSITIYDSNGKKMMDVKNINQAEKTVNSSELATGVYVLEVVGRELQKQTLKLVKE